jgi:hypothetical protein
MWFLLIKPSWRQAYWYILGPFSVELIKRKCRPAHDTILVTLPRYASGQKKGPGGRKALGKKRPCIVGWEGYHGWEAISWMGGLSWVGEEMQRNKRFHYRSREAERKKADRSPHHSIVLCKTHPNSLALKLVSRTHLTIISIPWPTHIY